MDKIELLFFFIAYAFYVYIPTKRAMQMYQQNRYNIMRYMTWLRMAIKDDYKRIIGSFLCLATCYGLLFVAPDYFPAILLLLLVLIYAYISYKIEEEKHYRKPLVFTSRILRLMTGCYIGYTFLFLIFILAGTTPFWILMTPYLYFLPWLMVLLIGSIMKPIETSIRKHYAAEAKHILRKQNHLAIIGITGSYGKTSVKTILYALLSDSYYTLMTPHSYNNQMGITLTIRQSLQRLHEVFICEMGADHVHEITALMQFVKPRYGVVTSVGPQHLQTFRSMENILHEKMQMIERLPEDGIGFLNKDNAYICSYDIHNACSIIWFAIHQEADYQACDIKYSTQGSTFAVLHDGTKHAFHTKLLGEHNVLNITCTIAIAHTLQVPWLLLQQAVERLAYVEHRLEVRKTSTYTILDDAYNANPQGAGYALDVLKQMPGKRFIVTPGFIDLGDQQELQQYQLGMKIAQCVDEVILVGRKQCISILKGLDEALYDGQHVHLVDSIHEAFTFLQQHAMKEDIVLLENDLPDAFHH